MEYFEREGVYEIGFLQPKDDDMLNEEDTDIPSYNYDGEVVKIAGIVKNLKIFYTKKDQKPLYVFQIEDKTGEMKAVIFSDRIELNQDKIIEEVKQCKSILKNKYNVKKLYLYGSYAKQKTSQSSDLDLLVIFDKELLNIERCKNSDALIKYLSTKLQITVDLLDFTHAMDNLDINEMENIITLI